MVPKPAKSAHTLKKGIPQLAVPKLRVKKLATTEINPCKDLLTAMLGCWASSGQTAAACLNLEQQLRQCMDTRDRIIAAKNPINSQLSRFYKSFRGPQKPRN